MYLCEDVEFRKLIGLLLNAKRVSLRGFSDVLSPRVFIKYLGTMRSQYSVGEWDSKAPT